MKIGPDKTKLMKNNIDGLRREKIKGQKLEELKSFKYLGSSLMKYINRRYFPALPLSLD